MYVGHLLNLLLNYLSCVECNVFFFCFSFQQVKCSKFSDDEDIDNSANWTNQDRELLSPCVGLVRTARASIRKVGLNKVM